MEIGKASSLEYIQLALIIVMCFGMALYEIRNNSQAVTAIASMLVKIAIIPLMAMYNVDIYWIAAVSLLPLSRVINIIRRKVDDKLDKDNDQSNRITGS